MILVVDDKVKVASVFSFADQIIPEIVSTRLVEEGKDTSMQAVLFKAYKASEPT